MADLYTCPHCEWIGTLDEAQDDASCARQGALCPECYSHIEPIENDSDVT